MMLGKVLHDVDFSYARGASDDILIEDVAYDSRRIVPGALFVCVPGAAYDGHHFAPSAVQKGAAALVVERELDLAVPQVIVSDARDALARTAANFFGNASQHMQVVGVTGTAGKTTVTLLVEHMLRAFGMECGVLGTISNRMGDRVFSHRYTTPESRDLQEILGLMKGMGAQAVAMEVSSHALLTHRCAHTRFAVAAFTNLSREHMDLHSNMEDYFATKARLFLEEDVASRVVCTSSPWGARLARMLREAHRDFAEVSCDHEAEVFLQKTEPRGPMGSLVHARAFGQELHFELPLLGRFNVENALVALALAHELGLDIVHAAASLAGFYGVPGRMERIDTGNRGFSVVVDFAHTPAELSCALRAAKEFASGRVAIVFGCGGDRDQGKRPMMGEAATQADFVVVTNDNPRTEDPASIAAQTVTGMGRDASRAHVQLDRREAIRDALDWARPGDVVLIAGKGHESTQTMGSNTLRFDDRQVVRELLLENAAHRARALAKDGLSQLQHHAYRYPASSVECI